MNEMKNLNQGHKAAQVLKRAFRACGLDCSSWDEGPIDTLAEVAVAALAGADLLAPPPRPSATELPVQPCPLYEGAWKGGKRGRPRKPDAMTSTERSRAHRARRRQEGGQSTG